MSRAALWPAVTPVADGAAPAAPPAQLPSGSTLTVQVKLAQLADVLTNAAELVREISREALDLHAQRALMSDVEKPVTPTRLLSAEDLAARLQVDVRTIRRWRRAGKIPPGIELGNSVLRWTSESIERWLS